METYLANRKGKKLFVRIDYPEVAKDKPFKKFPTVLVVHGFKGKGDQRHISGIASAIREAGMATVRPDLTKDPGKSYLNFSDMTYSQELADLEDIYLGLGNIDGVDFDRIGVTGHSLGGMLAAEVASKYSDIKSLVTLSAVYDFKFAVENIFMKPFEEAKRDFETQGWTSVWSQTWNREFQIRKAFYEDVALKSAETFSHRIKCPTLVISGEKDEAVAQAHADSYLKSINSKVKKMEIISGSDHNYSSDVLDRVAKAVARWFKDTL